METMKRKELFNAPFKQDVLLFDPLGRSFMSHVEKGLDVGGKEDGTRALTQMLKKWFATPVCFMESSVGQKNHLFLFL